MRRLEILVILFGSLAATRSLAHVPAVPCSGTITDFTMPVIGTALWRGMKVLYAIINGHPIYQADIILDNLIFGPLPIGASWGEQPASISVSRVALHSRRDLLELSLAQGGWNLSDPLVITNASTNLEHRNRLSQHDIQRTDSMGTANYFRLRELLYKSR